MGFEGNPLILIGFSRKYFNSGWNLKEKEILKIYLGFKGHPINLIWFWRESFNSDSICKEILWFQFAFKGKPLIFSEIERKSLIKRFMLILCILIGFQRKPFSSCNVQGNLSNFISFEGKSWNFDMMIWIEIDYFVFQFWLGFKGNPLI